MFISDRGLMRVADWWWVFADEKIVSYKSMFNSCSGDGDVFTSAELRKCIPLFDRIINSEMVSIRMLPWQNNFLTNRNKYVV